MEKYYKVSDVNEILNKLAKEPFYYHEGEGFYNGVCAVEGELMCLESVELEESKVSTWIKLVKDIGNGRTLTKYQCSECGVYLAIEANYCPNCGVKMKKELAND